MISCYAYMKPLKALLLLLALAVCLPAGAAVHDTGKKLGRRPHFLYSEFSLNKETILYTYGDEDIENTFGIYDFTILDSEFNETGKFTTPKYPEVTAEYMYARAIEGPKGITVSNTYEDVYENASKEEFAQYCVSIGFSTVENHGEEIWYLPDDVWNYYYGEYIGKRYPRTIYIWNNTANNGLVRYIEYDYSMWGPTGHYESLHPVNDINTPRPLYIYTGDANGHEFDDFMISQVLFNNDANFEWLVPILEAVDCSYTTDYEKVEGKRLRYTGFRIESQNGSTIASVKFPAGLYGAFWDDEAYLYIMNDKKYLLFDVRNMDETEAYYIVYEIDSASSSIAAVGAPRRVSVAPTAPRRGTDVKIDLGAPAETSCKVIVSSVNGQTVMIRNIEPGNTTMSIDTAGFEKGIYIVTVSDGKTTRENTKIVVR